MAGIKPPQPFDFHNAADWPSWIEEFEDYSFASGLSEKKEEIQVRTFLYTMGRKAREILRSLAVKDEDLKTFKVVKAKFEAYFVHTKNTVYESARFNRRRQQPGETVDEFATDLHKLAERCDFDNMKDRLIRDRFVVGLLDEALSEELQMDPKLTLATALARARTSETIKQQQADLKQREGTSAETYVAAVKNKKTEQKREWNATLARRKKTASVKSCTYCAGSMHPRTSCPAKQQKCFYCQKLGHFEKACRIKNRERKLDGVMAPGCPDNGCPDNERQFLGTVTPRQSKLSAHFVTVQINGHEVKMKVDTGAEVTVVGENFPGMPSYLEKAGNLRGPSDASIDTCGKFQAEIAWKDNRCEQTVYVVKNLHMPLLGLPAINALGVVRFLDELETSDEVAIQYPGLFQGIGSIAGEHTIRLTENAIPYAVSTPRRIPIPMKQAVKEELDRLEREGMIRKVEDPTEWKSSVAERQGGSRNYPAAIPNATVLLGGDRQRRRSPEQTPSPPTARDGRR
ncbi:uncharacterized protein [Dermacentor andersoni]|uniref:uncharacterized protein n=1 Tax=Dermacentor andersoni TaxID=34620 RepID=UPI003B3B9FAD